MVRAHVDQGDAVVVMGPFADPWNEARVRELLAPLAAECELVCRERPRPPQ